MYYNYILASFTVVYLNKLYLCGVLRYILFLFVGNIRCKKTI